MRISDWSSDGCSSDLPVDSFGHKEASVYRPAHRGALDMTQSKPRGVYVAALTPVKQDLGPDSAVFVRHCRWLLEQGANGLAVHGPTGRSGERRVGKEWVRKCSSRGWPDH